MRMQADPTLVLRGIHQPPAPSWWPPAAGWWVVAAIALLVVAVATWFALRRRKRRLALVRLFDQSVERAPTPAAKVAVISELLRRAARTQDPAADKLTGDDWLRFLDKGLKTKAFVTGAGSVLRDGAFRRDVPPQDVAALHEIARERFMQWVGAR